MAEKITTGIWTILKGSPTAAALLAMFWMGSQFMGTYIQQQAGYNQQLSNAIEKLAESVIDLHAHLEHKDKIPGSN